jgi:hypothetical protein
MGKPVKCKVCGQVVELPFELTLAKISQDGAPELMEGLERAAWSALARYKFWMFGYYAAQWVLINRAFGLHKPNVFASLVRYVKTTIRNKEEKANEVRR